MKSNIKRVSKQELATLNLYSEIIKDKILVNELLSVKPITKKHDEYETSADAQEIIYDYFNYWDDFRPSSFVKNIENADYLAILQQLELDSLNGNI